MSCSRWGEKEFLIGPRKVVSNSVTTLIYLGKDFKFLVGKKVMLLVKVLDDIENENKENKT